MTEYRVKSAGHRLLPSRFSRQPTQRNRALLGHSRLWTMYQSHLPLWRQPRLPLQGVVSVSQSSQMVGYSCMPIPSACIFGHGLTLRRRLRALLLGLDVQVHGRMAIPVRLARKPDQLAIAKPAEQYSLPFADLRIDKVVNRTRVSFMKADPRVEVRFAQHQGW